MNNKTEILAMYAGLFMGALGLMFYGFDKLNWTIWQLDYYLLTFSSMFAAAIYLFLFILFFFKKNKGEELVAEGKKGEIKLKKK